MYKSESGENVAHLVTSDPRFDHAAGVQYSGRKWSFRFVGRFHCE